MKQMTRDPLATHKARRAEHRTATLAIKPISLASTPSAGGNSKTSGFRKGGFRNAFGGEGEKEVRIGGEGEGEVVEVAGEGEGEDEDEDEDGRWGGYDPRRPTGCGEGCPGRG